MATRRETSGKYNKVDPDEYYQYEEQYVETVQQLLLPPVQLLLLCT